MIPALAPPLKGEIRVGPDLVTNPALHVTREMEDLGAWGFPMPIDFYHPLSFRDTLVTGSHHLGRRFQDEAAHQGVCRGGSRKSANSRAILVIY